MLSIDARPVLLSLWIACALPALGCDGPESLGEVSAVGNVGGTDAQGSDASWAGSTGDGGVRMDAEPGEEPADADRPEIDGSDASAGPEASPADAPMPLDGPDRSDAPTDLTRVVGRVVDDHGAAMSNVSVALSGQSVLTNDMGVFSFAAVAPEYDLMAYVSAARAVYAYQGLKLRNPVLVVVQHSDKVHTAAVQGPLVTDAGFASTTPLQFAGVAVREASSLWSNSYTNLVSNGLHYGPVYAFWDGAAPLGVKVYAIAWKASPDGFPAVYDAFGMSDVDLGTVSTQEVPVAMMEPVASHSIAVTSGTTPAEWVTKISLDLGAINLSGPHTITGPVNYLVPSSLSGISFALRAWAASDADGSYSGRTQLVGDASTNFAADLPAPPQLVSPSDAAIGVGTATIFQWSRFEGGIHRFSFSYQVDGGYGIYVYTASTSVTLPDLSVFGLAPISGVSASWYVTGLGPAKTIDDSWPPGIFSRRRAHASKRTCTIAPAPRHPERLAVQQPA